MKDWSDPGEPWRIYPPTYSNTSPDVVTAWVAAWRHYWCIVELMRPGWAHELEATVTMHVCSCRTELVDGGTAFHAVRRHNPACNIHGPAFFAGPPVQRFGKAPACMCRYGLHPTIWHPTHRVDVPGVGMRGAAYTFRIHPKCPHHGDGRVTMLEHVKPAWIVLDDEERRGD
jgi:hypothetical protein